MRKECFVFATRRDQLQEPLSEQLKHLKTKGNGVDNDPEFSSP